MSEFPLESIVVEAEQNTQFSIIWLHGLGASGDDFVPMVNILSPQVRACCRFIFPHAPIMPVTINNGVRMPAWYDIVSPDFDQRADLPSLNASTHLINAFIEAESQRLPTGARVFLGGFSQGAALSIYAGLRYPKKLAGIAALSGYLPDVNNTLEHACAQQQQTPIFIGHGTSDNVVPFELGSAMQQHLTKHHYAVTMHQYDIEHSVSNQEINHLDQWFNSIINQTTTNT